MLRMSTLEVHDLSPSDVGLLQAAHNFRKALARGAQREKICEMFILKRNVGRSMKDMKEWHFCCCCCGCWICRKYVWQWTSKSYSGFGFANLWSGWQVDEYNRYYILYIWLCLIQGFLIHSVPACKCLWHVVKLLVALDLKTPLTCIHTSGYSRFQIASQSVRIWSWELFKYFVCPFLRCSTPATTTHIGVFFVQENLKKKKSLDSNHSTWNHLHPPSSFLKGFLSEYQNT